MHQTLPPPPAAPDGSRPQDVQTAAPPDAHAEWLDAAGPLYRLQGADRDLLGAPHLYFAGDARLAAPGEDALARLEAGQWLGAGTWRNSFYAAAWVHHAPLQDLLLVVQGEGALRLRVQVACAGRPAAVLAEAELQLDAGVPCALPLPRLTDLPDGARLFWHVDALSACTLVDVAYATRTPPRRAARLAVMLRTWGRSLDARALLERFAAAGRQQAAHARALDAMEFWLLDASPDVAARQASPCAEGLDLRVIQGPNLGGGGNASHLLSLVRRDAAAREDAPDEWLILDDDLAVSFETLSRYRAWCQWRERDAVCSLPVLMKSQPTAVWEDGGLWGRFTAGGPHGLDRRRSLFPTLLKHGLKLDDYTRLDDFGPLNEPEYATFIFYGLPRTLAERLGPPAAFFLRGDDVEWSLRAAEAGVPRLTHPGLCAWHEPAHSYGQEYMAILHGMIVNLRYADNPAADSVRFFEERLYEHAAIGDEAGLAVYLAVLEDLLAETPAVLGPHFDAHYPPRLAALNAPPMQRLPPEQRAALEGHARDHGGVVLPFVHAGYHRPAPGAPPVLVVNPSTQAVRELKPRPFAERVPVMARYLALLGRLEAEHERLRERWSARLDEAGRWAFWEEVRDAQAPYTRLLWQHARPAVQRPPCPLGAAVRPLVQAFDAASAEPAQRRARLAAEVRRGQEAAQALRALGEPDGAEAAPPAQASAPPPAPGGLVARLRQWVFGPARAAAARQREALAPLPEDFDPAQYLMLNHDVARSGVDPALHYQRHGQREGRRYRLQVPKAP